MYVLQPKTKFRRDLRKAKKRGNNLKLLHQALELLTENGSLPEKYGAHPLKGEYAGFIDAHLEPDWVLIYEVIENEKTIVLHRTGRHQDVFKNY